MAWVCDICGRKPCETPGFCRACREADRQHRRRPAVTVVESGAPEGVVEALMYSLRTRGTKALAEPQTRRRLSEMSAAQVVAVGERLMRLRPEIARAWTADEVRELRNAG